MSNLGMRIEETNLGMNFEVGFNAGTREEFDSFLARLRMVADTIWPPSPAAGQGAIGADEPQTESTNPVVAEIAQGGTYAEDRLAEWKSQQGLR
jgi:hypothetical protein